MTTITTDVAVMAAGVDSDGVLSRLESTRQEIGRLQFWLGLVRLILAEVALGAAFVLADWMWVLPTAVRALGLAAMAVLVPVLIARSRRPLDRAGTAAEVEGHFPELGQRLRTVVEYAQPASNTMPASPGLLEALRHDTERRTGGLDFRELITWTAFERRAVVLFLAAAFALVTLFVSPGLRTAALRMLLLPRHYTSLEVEPGDLTLRAGHELELNVTLSGRPVARASWSYRINDGSGQWITAALASGKPGEPLIGTLRASLKNCQADFDYRVAAGEIESPTFHVKVVHPLVLKSLEATVTPPSYTHRPAEVVKDGNFSVIEGSRVQLAVTLYHLPARAELLVEPAADSSRQAIPLHIDGPRLTGELPPITKELEYRIDATDADGMKLEDAETYRIKAQLDEKPTICFIQPQEPMAVTATTEVAIQVEATDDLGVARVGINYKVGDGPEETLYLGLFPKQPVTAQGLVTLYLEKHTLTFTDAITYHAFVEDSYPPQSHRVESELRFIDILPYKQEYQVVEGSGVCNGSLTLEELIARQRVNLNRTFASERDRPVADATARRLAAFEEELAAVTAEFSDGLKAIGAPVPALDDAAAAMRLATESLAAKELAAARPHEESALKELISARQNLRKLLGSSSGAGRSFDVKQFQKIRRPRADKTKKQLANLENGLRELARREQKFAEEIEARGRGGPQLDPPPEDETEAQNARAASGKPSSPRPGSSSGGSSGQDSQARMTPAERQRQAAEHAERLLQLASHDEALTKLANRRLEAAVQAVQESRRSIEAAREAEAALAARDAARKLESAARQVGALTANELTDRLARQRDLARAIAKAERELGQALERKTDSKDGPDDDQQRLAEKQSELADDVAALADVLNRLKTAAAEEQPELVASIGRAARSNPPEEIEESMRENAAAIGKGRTIAAMQSADRAAGQLDALAQDLESVRRAAIAPQLDRLLATEKQAAALQEQLRSVKRSSQQAGVEKSLAEFARVLDHLASSSGPLRDAADQLSKASQSSPSGWISNNGVQLGGNGYFVPPAGYSGSLAAVLVALQSKIQEIVLDNALIERTGPVPPQYKSFVEDYYRVLSQDLR